MPTGKFGLVLRAFTTLVLLLSVLGVRAQQPAWAVGVRGGYGYLIAHHDNLKRMVAGHIPSGEIMFERRMNGKRAWHHRYAMPTWGIGFWAADLRAEELGNGFRLTPYIALPLSRGEQWALQLRFGWGIGYITRPFHREENYKGQAIGSAFNVNMPLGLEYTRRFGRTDIGVGLCIEHQSNGAFKVPNLGINVPSVQVCLKQHFGAAAQVDTTRIARLDDTWSFIGYSTIGVKETFPVNGDKFLCYAAVLAYLQPLSPKFVLEGGIDYFHNGALNARAERLSEALPPSLHQLGVHVGGGLRLEKMTIIWQAGGYVANVFPDDGFMFNRVGIRHRLGKRWLINFTLKTHLATADHFELGFGYRIR